MSQLLIQCIHLFKSFDQQLLFDDLALSIHQGDVLALVGENGSGKTTLLQMLVGNITADTGSIKRASHLKIGFLQQEIESTELSVRAYIEEGPLSKLEKQMAICLEDPALLQQWETFHDEYEKLGGYKRIPLEKVFSGLKLGSDVLDSSMATLSSGQKVRVALAKALMENPDLLLLDEPTNHLDLQMLSWLEEMLRSREGATVIVSHDREFLNTTCNRFIEIDKGKVINYTGNYDDYLQSKKHLEERALLDYAAQQEEKLELKKKIKATTFAKRKAPPPSDRNIMAYDARGENHQKSLQHNLDKWKARLEEIEKNPLKHPHPKTITGLKFTSVPLQNRVAIEIEAVSKAFGDTRLFENLNKVVCRGDRIILIGANGSGKTTLLRCLAGMLPVDAGIIRYTTSAKIGYLDQEIHLLPNNKTPLKYFEENFNLSEEELRSELHKAAIGGSDLLQRPFSTLSTGQRKRFMILVLVLQKPNVLLLDEPTNHLDFATLEALETALINFEGAILAVSHDVRFIKKMNGSQWVLSCK